MKIHINFIISLFLILFSGPLAAQNLVPNPGFELINNCPTLSTPIRPLSQGFPFVQNWFAYTSAWYFNTCVDTSSSNPSAAPNSFHTVPSNIFGIREPHSGNAYAGIMIALPDTSSGTYNMCVQTQLTSALEANHWYCVSFYVSLALRHDPYGGTPNANISSGTSTDQIGAFLSATVPGDPATGYQPLNVTPQVVNPAGHWLDDTTGWTRVTGIFMANGGEQWITITNFDDNAGTNPVNYTTTQSSPWPMYFIDDVHVSKITTGSGPQHNPPIGSQDTTICSDIPTGKTLYAPSGADSYLWSNGSVSDSITATQTGTFWYTAVYNDCGMISDTITLSLLPLDTLELGNDTALCAGNTVVWSSNVGALSYQWNTGATTPDISVHQSGTYTLTITDGCGMQTDSVSVTFHPIPSAPPALDTVICRFSDVNDFSMNGPGIRWYERPDGGASFPVPPISTENVSEYMVYATQTAEGCESQRTEIRIEVIAAPTVELAPDTLFCPESGPLVGVQALEHSQYLWNTGATEPVIAPEKSGIYILVVSNPCGIAEDSIHVRIDECVDCAWLPNSFTPNGDGRNDYFGVEIICPMEKFSFLIYNRWGNKVFESYRPDYRWDGGRVEAGTYFYQLQYQNANNHQFFYKKGDVTLIK